QCLRDLRITDPRDDKSRIQKRGLLRDSYYWVFENETFKAWRNDTQGRILWINGDPGKGKTMLLCGIIDELMPKTKLAESTDQTTNNTLLSFFFCQGTNAYLNNATAVLRGLIYLLIIQEPSLISHIKEKHNHAGKSLFEDSNAWVALLKIFLAILQDLKAKEKELVLIIDALDECETDLFELLDVILQQFPFPHIRYIISSRNIIDIRETFEPYIQVHQKILNLNLEQNTLYISEAIDVYIKHSISNLLSIRDDSDLRDKLHRIIQQKAHGTFLWVSLVMKELKKVRQWDLMMVVEEFPEGLAALYKRMISQVNELKRGNAEHCRNILSTILTAYYPLNLAELGVLVNIPSHISERLESITELVIMCGSFLTLNNGNVYFIHQSAKDFLSTEIFSTGVTQRHINIFKRSIELISKLPKNIFCLPDFGPRPKDAQPPNPNPLASMKYPCFYWVNHLCDTYATSSKDERQLILSETLEPFLKTHLLRWIESLSLLDGVPEGLRSIRKLLHKAWLLSAIEKFILSNGSIISQAPLQVYGSALIFSPMSSELKATQWDERLSFIRGFQGLRTTVFLQSIKGHTGKITALAFSPDGETLASKSKDETICFWDVATGVLKETVECHCDGASAIAFSPDNKTLMLATFGNPTLGRDAETGEFQKDSDGITAFSFSSDRETLASGLRNGSILIWDATTGMYQRTIKSFFGKPETIAFSPDSRRIASGFTSRIWLFDATTRKYLMAIDETTRGAGAIAFCQDNKRLVVGMMDNSIRVYDIARDVSARTLMSGGDSAIAISPDNKILASASDDYIIRLWDATMGIQEEHMQEEDPRNYPRDAICETAISPDGKILASTKVHPNDIVQLWDLATRTCQELDPGRSLEVTAIAFSPDSKTLASGSDLEIRLWDVVTGACRQTLTNFKYTQILAIGFSPDGKKLAVGLRFGIMMLLDVMTGKPRPSLQRYSSVAFSPDGTRLAS
ncbi:uncharacterized protein TRIVIDRAFT_132350, partial [Trichoderma virens Gv29-8]